MLQIADMSIDTKHSAEVIRRLESEASKANDTAVDQAQFVAIKRKCSDLEEQVS